MKLIHVSLAIGAALVSAGAIAQAPGGGWQQKDQTRAEAQQRADRLFQMLDSNKDGTVTRAEADQALAQFAEMRGGDDNGGHGSRRMERMIDQAFGGAQALTKQQFDAQVLARFGAADLNHDGILTAAERGQARAAMRPAQPVPGVATPQ
jgi:hypothetical protein